MTMRALVLCAGCGPGAAELITPATWMAALSADLLVGPRRLLDLFPGAVGEKRQLSPRPSATLAGIAEGMDADRSVTLLVEGDAAADPLVRRVTRRFGSTRCRVLPGVSVVASALARLRLDSPWIRLLDPLDSGEDDADGLPVPLPPPDDSWAESGDLAVCANEMASWSWTADLAEWLNLSHEIHVCENLSLPGERVARLDAYEMRGISPRPLTLAVLARKTSLPPPEA